jgi:hypothetical protein
MIIVHFDILLFGILAPSSVVTNFGQKRRSEALAPEILPMQAKIHFFFVRMYSGLTAVTFFSPLEFFAARLNISIACGLRSQVPARHSVIRIDRLPTAHGTF